MRSSRHSPPASRRRLNWPEVAEHLAAAIPRERLHPAVLAWAAKEYPGTKGVWTVALSGGADSVALLLLLWAHWPERRRTLRVVHFNHRIRGRAATRDELFCRRLCAALGVRFAAGRWRSPPRNPSEAAARTARFAFFDRQMRSTRSRALWLGHQLDDVAESMLMRLARGSGTAGLAAPRPLQAMPDVRAHVRPLLTLNKAFLVSALGKAGGRWCEDATNEGDQYFRNRIRQSVIPAWCSAAEPRDPVSGAAISRELLDEDAAALDFWLADVAPLRPDGSLDLRLLDGKPRALWRRALHAWLRVHPAASELSRQGFASLLEAAEAGVTTRRSLGAGRFAVVRGGHLKMEQTRTGAHKRQRTKITPPSIDL